MAFEFDKLASGGGISEIVDPTTLFDALPNKADGYGYLRAVQKTVLDAWSERRDERDVVIKTNTGGGKTIVGLLLLQCSLHENQRPALYLAPDQHLVKQVVAEANALGLGVVDRPEDSRFLSGEAICVTTMRVLVNGKSRFGLADWGSRQPVNVGSIVVDDAHAALALTEENTRLEIPGHHDCHGQILDLFEDELKAQGLNAYMDIRDGDPRALLRIPFWAWRSKESDVLGILRPHRDEEEFKWSWALVADSLSMCQAVVTATSLEIVPPCPPIEKFPSFAEAYRRIYLTATLADDSVLVTHFDADPQSLATCIVPDSAADLGDRLILAPQELNPDITHQQVRELATKVAQEHNVVVLAPSWRIARIWESESVEQASTADQITALVERLSAGEHVGLVTIVNRYDGIDLPDEACRLLIIDSLPFAFSGAERREAIALRDSDAMVTRQLQRIEQGMGRGVRSRDDRCVVFLLGSRLIQLVARAGLNDQITPATRAQLNLSRKVAANLVQSSPDELLEVVDQVIQGDPDFKKLSREELLGATFRSAELSPSSQELRAAYNAAIVGQDREASEHARLALEAARELGDQKLAGWIGETHALYTDRYDPVEAQRILNESVRENSAVLKPLSGLDYQQIETGSTQAEQLSRYLAEEYVDGTDLVMGFEALRQDIRWDPEGTDEAEAGLEDLGSHLGFSSQRPELVFGIGSDVLWVSEGPTYLVIEAKTGSNLDSPIWKKDINQLAGSVNWCESEYGTEANIIPVLVHPNRVLEGTGTAPEGAVVITEKKLKGLGGAIYQFSRAIAQDGQYKDPTAVEKQLQNFGLTLETLLENFTEPTRRKPKEIL